MAFYLRKSFKAGPLRLNLSKSGLGLSGGVTGARVGVNSRGLYLHGGRHGLYYRKYAKKGKRRRGQPSGLKRSATAPIPVHSPVDLFRDTGATFVSRTSELNSTSAKGVELPSSKLLTAPVKGTLWVTAILLIISWIFSIGWMTLTAILIAAGLGGWFIREQYWQQLTRKKYEDLVTMAESGQLPGTSVEEMTLPDRWKAWLSQHLQAVIGELVMSRKEFDTLSALQDLDSKAPISKSVTDQIRASILSRLLDDMLEDHLLSEEEERQISELIDHLDIPEEQIASVRERMEFYSRIRQEIERPLKELDPGVPLVRGEKAYEKFKTTRLLFERVLNRFQRDNVQYRELGYEVDLEGQLILTDRRLLFVGRGSREYRLTRILDITADPEAGIVELTLSGRKSPLLITTPEPLVLAARIEKVVAEL